MHTNDIQLTQEDIGQLENTSQLIHFFARLGYDVDDAIPLDHVALSLDTEALRQQIRRIHEVIAGTLNPRGGSDRDRRGAGLSR